MFTVYLAGYINGNKIKECAEWRIKIREYYNNWKGCQRYPIKWLDPLNGKELNTIDGEGLHSNMPDNALIHRDYQAIVDSDLIIANLKTFGEKRPVIGTIAELAWAWDKHKEVIIISDEPQYYDHPFIKYFASAIFPDVDSLLASKVINYFYKGKVSALYTYEDLKKLEQNNETDK